MTQNYWQPTPKKFRQIGDAILLGSTSLSAMMMGAPVSEGTRTWLIFGLNIMGVLGKVITNFFKESDATDTLNNNSPKPQ